jgi:cell division protein ZapA (FtsZ GTPase activity inhibitor)
LAAERNSEAAPESVRVRLFGREYSIRGHGDKQYVQELADFINGRAEEIESRTSAVSTLDLVVLTVLNVTDEMFRYKRVTDETIRQLEDKADGLLKAIDRVV